MTLTEAAACGTPAVATRIAGHTDAVVDTKSGLLADTETEFAEHLVSVCLDDDLRARLAKGALEHAAQFRWEATAIGVLRALAEETLGTERRGRTGRWR